MTNNDRMFTAAPPQILDRQVGEAINLDTYIVPVTHAGNEWLKGEIARVEAELAAAQAENATLKTENADMRQEMVELHEELAATRSEVDRLQCALANMNGYLRLAINAAGLFELSDSSRQYLRIHQALRARRHGRL
jgi:septal ring factor EnvC (AmiA/AmiB activator)